MVSSGVVSSGVVSSGVVSSGVVSSGVVSSGVVSSGVVSSGVESSVVCFSSDAKVVVSSLLFLMLQAVRQKAKPSKSKTIQSIWRKTFFIVGSFICFISQLYYTPYQKSIKFKKRCRKLLLSWEVFTQRFKNYVSFSILSLQRVQMTTIDPLPLGTRRTALHFLHLK